MIKTNPDINYGSALSSLFQKFKDAEKALQQSDKSIYAYANYSGRLSGAIKGILIETDAVKDYAEIDAAIVLNNNDIPETLFQSPNAK